MTDCRGVLVLLRWERARRLFYGIGFPCGHFAEALRHYSRAAQGAAELYCVVTNESRHSRSQSVTLHFVAHVRVRAHPPELSSTLFHAAPSRQRVEHRQQIVPRRVRCRHRLFFFLLLLSCEEPSGGGLLFVVIIKVLQLHTVLLVSKCIPTVKCHPD